MTASPPPANARPRYSDWADDPRTYAPPCTHTITGLPAPASVSEDAHTFSVRESSPWGAPRSIGIRGSVGCGQTGPTLVASATSAQRSGGCGARHRSSPTGGAAYRTPLHDLTVP